MVRAFSSVGRALPLQGRCREFEPLNAHHKRQDDICYLVFYFEILKARTPQNEVLSEFERERAEGKGLLFVKNKVFENKNRRPVYCERPRQPLNKIKNNANAADHCSDSSFIGSDSSNKNITLGSFFAIQSTCFLPFVNLLLETNNIFAMLDL